MNTERITARIRYRLGPWQVPHRYAVHYAPVSRPWALALGLLRRALRRVAR